MTKLAIIDLDGVIADATARFALAEQTANAKYQKELSRGSWTDLYWKTVFTSANVEMDTPIPGAVGHIIDMEADGYKVVYLTSRLESMRDATAEWLYYHQFNTYHKDASKERQLIMKPLAFQFTKTVVWKAGTVQMLAALFEADEVLFVDDEAMNIAELQKYEHPFKLRCATSLDIAVNGEPEPDEPESDSRF